MIHSWCSTGSGFHAVYTVQGLARMEVASLPLSQPGSIDRRLPSSNSFIRKQTAYRTAAGKAAASAAHVPAAAGAAVTIPTVCWIYGLKRPPKLPFEAPSPSTSTSKPKVAAPGLDLDKIDPALKGPNNRTHPPPKQSNSSKSSKKEEPLEESDDELGPPDHYQLSLEGRRLPWMVRQ